MSADKKSIWKRDLLELIPQRAKTASKKESAVICRQLSFMLEAGVPLKEAVSVLTGQRTHRRLQVSLQTVFDSIMRGEELSLAMERSGSFPLFMCNMCRVGEVSDNLPRVMSQLADYYEQISHTETEIRSALLYPTVVSALMLIVILIAVLFILPGYVMVFSESGIELPALTRALLSVNNFLMTKWYIIAIAAPALWILWKIFSRGKSGRAALAFVLLYCPVVRDVYRQLINLRITQGLALLLESGQPLPNAVLVVSDITQNAAVKRNLQKIAVALEEGSLFWTHLAEIPYIDPLLSGMARVGEETGQMPQTFEHARKYSLNRFENMTRRLNKLVEPAVTLALGVLMGLVMLSIMLPTFALTGLM